MKKNKYIIVALSILVLPFLAARPAGADSFLTSVDPDVSDLNIPVDLNSQWAFDLMAKDRDAFHHMALITLLHGYDAGTWVTKALNNILKKDTQDPWKLFDAGFSEIYSATYTDSKATAKSGIKKIRNALAAEKESPSMMLVAALALAQADAFPLHQDWDTENSMKKEVMQLIEDACSLNKTKPARGFEATLRSAMDYMVLYGGYKAFAAKTLECAATKPAPTPAIATQPHAEPAKIMSTFKKKATLVKMKGTAVPAKTVAKPEVLNGLDDDLDGLVDEDFVATGDMQVTLWWSGGADLDLIVEEPGGGSINHKAKTGKTGGTMDKDSRGTCKGGQTVENIHWKGAPPDGTYKVKVKYYSTCKKASTTTAYVTLSVGSKVVASTVMTLKPKQKADVIEFSIK
jgi:hypothetical protein